MLCTLINWKFKCNDSVHNKGLINIKTRCSNNIHERLQFQFDSDSCLVLQAHKVSVEKYLHPKEV